jgi:NAD(P)-dependent dehydrogenase (short-subunit alcohol dehydrogenase family)
MIENGEYFKMEAKLLDGKTALISGAASGIGEEIGRLFAREGAKVVLFDVTPSGERIVEELKVKGLEAYFKTCDVTKANQVKAVVDFAVAETGKLDVLVNVAGILDFKGITETEEDVWDRVVAVNLKGVFLTMKNAIPYMLKNGGSIVNVSSISSVIFRSVGIGDAYSASKAGVNGLTNSVAVKYAKYGIRCNAIMPGAIETPMTKEGLSEWDPRVPLRRVGQPEDVAHMALFLASDYSSFLTAANIPLAGGAHAAQAPSKKRS